MRTPSPVRGRPLDYLTTFSFVLLVRDVWLAATGGGSTPRWMLAIEITTTGCAVVTGLAAKQTRSKSELLLQRSAVRLSVAAGSIAFVVHLARLLLYLRDRTPKPTRMGSSAAPT